MKQRLALFLLLLPLLARAEIIPSTNRCAWIPGVTVGVPGGIPHYSVYTNLYPLGGGQDDKPQIDYAIAFCATNMAVFLNAGTYTISNRIEFQKSYVCLRGAGTNLTKIEHKGSTAPLAVIFVSQDSGPQNDQALVSGYGQGATNLVVTDGTSFAVGDLVTVYAQNCPGFARNYTASIRLSQLVRVTAKSGANITIWPPLYYPYIAANVPRIFRFVGSARNNIGIEDLSITSTHPDITAGISISQAYGCWVKSVESHNLAGNHILLVKTLQCEVRDCFIHDSSSAGPSNGYGIILYGDGGRTNSWVGATATLVENNVLTQCQPAISMQMSCNGNVFAYNFCWDSRAPPYDMGWDIGVHQGHPMYNLIEGNVVHKIEFDGYHGSSSHNVVFRNHSGVTHPNPLYDNQIALAVNRWNYHSYFVGNILGDSRIAPSSYLFDTDVDSYSISQKIISRWGYPNTGNGNYDGHDYTLPYGTNGTYITLREMAVDDAAINVRHGNYDLNTLTTKWDPAIADHVLPSSLFRTVAPSWWPVAIPWPPIGPDVAAYTNAIPAQAWYFNSNQTNSGIAGLFGTRLRKFFQ